MNATKKQQLLLASLDDALTNWKWLSECPGYDYIRQNFNDFDDDLLDAYHQKLLVDGFYTITKPLEILKVNTEKYILDGNSRIYALSLLRVKYPEIPINPIRYYYLSDMTPLQVLRHQKISNDDIREHKPSQKMRVIASYLDKGYKNVEIAEALGISAMDVSSAKRFTNLPVDIQQIVDNNEISLQSILKVSQAADSYSMDVSDAISKVREYRKKERISLADINAWRDYYEASLAPTPVILDIISEKAETPKPVEHKKHIDVKLPEISKVPIVSEDVTLIHVDVNGDIQRLSRLFHATAIQVLKMSLEPDKVNEIASMLNSLLLQVPELDPIFIDNVNKI